MISCTLSSMEYEDFSSRKPLSSFQIIARLNTQSENESMTGP